MADVSLELQVKYLRKRLEEIAALDLRSLNLSATRKIGHQVRGNAKPFGFEELGPIGTRLESASVSKDAETAASLIQELRSRCQAHLDRLTQG